MAKKTFQPTSALELERMLTHGRRPPESSLIYHNGIVPELSPAYDIISSRAELTYARLNGACAHLGSTHRRQKM
jgi:hypothetical protein